MKIFSRPIQLVSLVLTAAMVPAFGDTLVIGDTYNVTTATTGFALNNGVNFGINPPTTRLTGTAAANLRYYQTATGRATTFYGINGNRLRVLADVTIGRFTLSANGTSAFDFAPALGTGSASPANPLVYDLKIRMQNNAANTARMSFALGTAEGDATTWDFGIQLHKATSGATTYTHSMRVNAASTSGVTNVNNAMGTGNTAGSEVSYVVRVIDAGAESGANYNSRALVSRNGSWIYYTAADPEISGWRLDGAGRSIMFDQAGNSADVFYDEFSLTLFPVKTWTGGGGNNNWNTAANWDGSVVARDGDSLIFDGTTRPANNNNVAAANLTFVPSITFNNGGFTISGNSLTVTRSITNLAGDNTLNNALTINNASSIHAGAGSLVLGGILSGGGSVVKSGTGSATLSGANNYSGATTVNQGALLVNGSTASGSAVTVAAAGTLGGTGVINGTVAVTGTLSAGASVGKLTTGAITLNAGGTNLWEISSATGTAGTDWDLVDAGANNVDVQSSSGTPFTFKLSAVGLGNFDKDTAYSWPAFNGTVQNFSADKFVVDDSGFTNDLAGGTFFIEAGALKVAFTNNHAPAANVATYAFSKGTVIKPFQIPISAFLAANTTDADDDARSLILLTSTNATVSTNATHITVSSANDKAESIQYVVKDVRNYRAGDSVRMATNYIAILRTNSVGTLTVTNSGGGEMGLSFHGVPGYTYVIQRSPDLSAWTDIVTNTAPGNGLVQFTETPPWSPAFYRTRTE